MIQKIIIKNTATFDTEGVEIDNLKKINFIYGANGCGKTTISNIIASPESYADSSIFWTSDNKEDVLVYNKAFREKNFGMNNIPGVFTLGEATKEQIEELKQKKEKLRELNQQIAQKENEIEKNKKELEEVKKQFNENCWTRIKSKYNSLFKEAFIGFSNSKANFAQKVLDSAEKVGIGDRITYDDLVSRAATLFGEMPSIIQPLPQLTEIENIQELEEDVIWAKKVVGKADVAIAPLIKRLGISDWVNKGRSLLEKGSETCPFCQKKTIDQHFREDIEAYFDETFVLDSKKLKENSDLYMRLKESISNQLASNLEKDRQSSHMLDLYLFEANQNSLIQLFSRNREIIESKLKEPSRSLTLQKSINLISWFNEAITIANNKIKSHNDIVNNFSKEKNQLIDDVWAYIIKEDKDLIDSFVRTKSGRERGISKLGRCLENLKQQCFILNEEIKEGNKNVTSVQSSVDEINKTLSAYGFTNFLIDPVDEHFYRIKRENGEIANNTLSEGETTFLTFLYFMQLVKGGNSPETANSDRVVVIDDPISSLDSTILFVVSSLIKEQIKKIKRGESNILQLILLTHNVYFHKEVSFIGGRTGKNNDTWFWILRKNNNRSTIQCYEQENPIQGSYELLWNELRNRNKNKISIITLQNTMRRIYETYFKVFGKYDDDYILQKFSNLQEKEICRSLLCWVNDGSHCVPDDCSLIPDQDQEEKYLEVFKRVFEVSGHEQHYNMMMGIEDAD
jgi:wobble nucleotide-excising tRNase